MKTDSILIVGDIHGCLKTFKKLIARFPEHRVSLVGDLIDRGPNSIGVVDYVMANQDRIDCVRGNHELMAQQCKHGMRLGYDWTHNGGDIVYNQYMTRGGEKKFHKHVDWFESLPAYRSYVNLELPDGRYLVVSHSIITNKNILLCESSQAIYWGRHFPDKDVSEGEWFNVFGHTPTPYMWEDKTREWEPFFDMKNGWANIDTGCVYRGKLTGLLFPELTWVQEDNIDKPKEKDHEASP